MGAQNDPAQTEASQPSLRDRMKYYMAVGKYALSETPRTLRIAADTPSVLASSLPSVQRMRIEKALETLSSIPEGKVLVDALKESGIPVTMSKSPLDHGGRLETFGQVLGDRMVHRPVGLKVPAFAKDGELVQIFAHELQHLLQAKADMGNAFNGALRTPQDAILHERAKEADAQATAVDIAYKLKRAGQPDAWNVMQRQEDTLSTGIVKAYGEIAEKDPSSVDDGRAKRAAFDAWYTSSTIANRALPEIYNAQGLRHFPRPDEISYLSDQGCKVEPLTHDDLKKLGTLSPVNYLDIPGGRSLTDEGYRNPMLNENDKYHLGLLTGSFQNLMTQLQPPPQDLHSLFLDCQQVMRSRFMGFPGAGEAAVDAKETAPAQPLPQQARSSAPKMTA